MAIMGPSDLPVVLKVRSDQMKHYVLSKLGYPAIDVEISESQLEAAIRVTGDFIAGYFPREQKLAVFNTEPLRSTYPMPEDAYWIQSVHWDPITTRIDDVFGAESFLFCFSGGTKLLTNGGPRSCEEIAENTSLKLETPFGQMRPTLRWNQRKQPVQVLKTEKDYLVCTPNHPVNLDSRFRMSICGFPGMRLMNQDDKQPEIVDRERLETDGTWSVATECGCFYASSLGEEFYLVH